MGTLQQRIEAAVLRDDASGCWNWAKARNRQGYGWIKVAGRLLGAHRVAYEVFVGEIPKGLVVHHRCKNKGCVNPEHLTVLSTTEHRRGHAAEISHCPQGHSYAEYSYEWGGRRYCRECRRVRHRAWVDRNREIVNARKQVDYPD